MIKSISATSINLYNTCPKQWQYKYVYKLLQPDNPAFIIGIAYHKALEMYHLELGATMKDGNPCALEDIIDEMKKNLMPNKTKEEIERFRIVRMMFECYRVNPAEGDTLQTEYKFSFDLIDLELDLNLIGYIDRVTPTSIIDYKTTSKDYTEEDCLDNIQTDIYSYIMWKERGEFPDVVYHIMNKKKVGKNNYKPQIFTFKRTPDDMLRLEYKIKEFYKNVMDENFEGNCGDHCFWCSHRQICPYK